MILEIGKKHEEKRKIISNLNTRKKSGWVGKFVHSAELELMISFEIEVELSCRTICCIVEDTILPLLSVLLVVPLQPLNKPIADSESFVL